MPKYKVTDFEIQTDNRNSKEIKVVNLDGNNEPVVSTFELSPLHKKGDQNYNLVKARYGPLAVTDPERASRSLKDRRFSLNPLLRDPLSVEQEEKRVIEEKVRIRIDTLAEDAKKTASEEGYQDGLKKGYEEAFKKFQEESAPNLQKFDQLVQEAEKAKVEIFRANERFLVELVFRIARMVMLKELSTDRDYVLRLAKELISRVGVRENITIRVHPNDAETLDLLKGGLEKAYGAMSNLHIEASQLVKRGGCQIETEWNAIDASIDTQLDGLLNSLVGKSQENES